MEPLLCKRTYKRVLKGLEHYKKQHIEDRKENPGSIPPSWGSSLKMMIEDVVREMKEQRYYKGLAEQVLEYLVGQKLLVRYVGDYTFPTDEELPNREQIVAVAEKTLKKFYHPVFTELDMRGDDEYHPVE